MEGSLAEPFRAKAFADGSDEKNRQDHADDSHSDGIGESSLPSERLACK